MDEHGKFQVGDEIFFIFEGKVLFGRINYQFYHEPKDFTCLVGETYYQLKKEEIITKKEMAKRRISNIE